MSYLCKRKTVLLAAFLLSAPHAIAQSSFEEGSFGASGETPTQQDTTSVSDTVVPPPNSFGGSFDEGGGGGGSFDPGSFDSAVTPTPEPETTAVVTIPGGADFQDGSFEDEEGVTPTPPPQDVVVNPPEPNPEPPAIPEPEPSGPTIDPQITAIEMRDFGVPPTQQLRNGQFHSPTPTSIPGGQIVTTQHLVNAINANMQMLLIDVLGGQYSLPNAYTAQAMSQGGHFNDHIQQQTVQWLGQISGGQREIPIVIFCSDPMCWLSYNASLRAINAGYTNVYWYRGGVTVWQQAGLPLQPASF